MFISLLPFVKQLLALGAQFSTEFLTSYNHILVMISFVLAAFNILSYILKGYTDQQKQKIKPPTLQVKCLNKLYQDRVKHLRHKMKSGKTHLFVFDFIENKTSASARHLATMVDVILDTYQPGDEALLRLESGGGSMVSFGLYASILTRLRQAKGLTFKVAIDTWAASGGYMMAVVAHQILCAPVAVVGSIGVISESFNYHRLLNTLGIEVEQHTAGIEKRNVTKYGKTTEEKRLRLVEELQEAHLVFKDFIKTYRPALDIEAVATGKIWYGNNALAHQLIDTITTSDAFLHEKSKSPDYQILMLQEAKPVAKPKQAASRTRTMPRLMKRAD